MQPTVITQGFAELKAAEAQTEILKAQVDELTSLIASSTSENEDLLAKLRAEHGQKTDMHFELEDQRTRTDQLCMELEALTNELQAAKDGASSAAKKLWKTERREEATVKLAASRQDEICALKLQLGDLATSPTS